MSSLVDLSLDDIIAQGRKDGTAQRGQRSRRASFARVEKQTPSERLSTEGKKPPPARASDYRDLDDFANFKKKGKGANGKTGCKGKGKTARYEPYGFGFGRGDDWGPWGTWFDPRPRRDSEREAWAPPPQRWDGAPTRRVLIRNLDYGILEEDLHDALARFGLERAWIDYDFTDRSLGTGGAIFVEPAAAMAACRHFHGNPVVPHGQPIHMEPDFSGGNGKAKGKGKDKR